MSTLNDSVRRDEQRTSVWWGVSSVDGTTLVEITVDSSTGDIMVENGVSVMPVIAALPKTLPRDGNRQPCLGGVSNANANVFIPVSVNPTTGAVMVQET